MGSENFDHYSEGADVKVAFREAQEAARYNYGHSGYTGTIAEKDSAVIITEAGTLAYSEALELADTLLDDPRVDDKWGPAGAIRVSDTTHDGWLFFGWASS